MNGQCVSVWSTISLEWLTRRSSGQKGHDIYAVSWKDCNMRVVLEQPRRGLDAFRLDDKVAAKGVHGSGDTVLGHARRLAHHATTIEDGCGVSVLPRCLLFQADGIDRVLLGLGQAAERGEVFGLHGVHG